MYIIPKRIQYDCPLNLFFFWEEGNNLRGRYAAWLRDLSVHCCGRQFVAGNGAVSCNSFDEGERVDYLKRLLVAVTCHRGGRIARCSVCSFNKDPVHKFKPVLSDLSNTLCFFPASAPSKVIHSRFLFSQFLKT